MTPKAPISSIDPLHRIFAYRAFDLRDRFPQPLETFREALECLQSDRSYMAAMSGEIIAYLRGGYALTVPDHFFLRRSFDIETTLVPSEENDVVCDAVDNWLRTTLYALDKYLLEVISLEERPCSLNHLLQQCNLRVPELGELNESQGAPDMGGEVLDAPNEIDVWKAAEELFMSREAAERWMTSPRKAFHGRTPAKMAVEQPQKVYDFILRLEHGILS